MFGQMKCPTADSEAGVICNVFVSLQVVQLVLRLLPEEGPHVFVSMLPAVFKSIVDGEVCWRADVKRTTSHAQVTLSAKCGVTSLTVARVLCGS